MYRFSGVISKSLLITLGCMIYLFQGVVSAQTVEPAILMPTGYTLPTMADPIPDPQGYITDDRVRLSFHGPDLVVHRVPMDTTPLHWADDLLTVVVGFPGEDRGWEPTSRYQVHPVGPPGHGHDPRAMALLGDELIIFVAPLRGQPPQPYKSVNQIGYTIALAGHEIVVTKENDRRWFFQSNDFGASWRLARMELVARPKQFVTLIYDEDGLTALELPNGRKFELTYTQKKVTSIHGPFGNETRIKYDNQGLISQIDQYLSDAPDGKARFRVASYSYTYDEKSRLQTFLDDRRVPWTCTYQLDEATGGRSPVLRQYTTSVTNAEGLSLFQRIQVRRDGRYARMIGSSDRQTTMDAAMARYQFSEQVVVPWEANTRGKLKGKKPSGRKSKNTSNEDDSASGITAGSHGVAMWLDDTWPRSLDDYQFTMRYLPWPRSIVTRSSEDQKAIPKPRLQYDSLGRAVSAYHLIPTNKPESDRASSSPTANKSISESSTMTIRYAYSTKGDLVEAVVDDQKHPHQFTTDPWGRIVKHQKPDESYTQWVFDDVGRLVERLDAMALPKDPKDLFADTQFQISRTKFSYDQFGRLLLRTTDDQAKERFIYNPSGQLTTTLAGGPATTVHYRYDRLGSLIQQDQANGDRMEYDYYTDGRIARQTQKPKNDRWVIRDFDPQGQIIAETVEKLGRTQYEYDDRRRQITIIHPNGKDTRYTYDELNRIVTIRGDAQPPADISYDKDGQRVVTTPKEGAK